MTVATRLIDFLEENQVDFEEIEHATDYTAQATAAHTHTPGRAFAKTVIVTVDSKPVMLVMPAHHIVDLERVRVELGADEVRLSTEMEAEPLFPDSERGAEPPFGNLYELPVYVSRAMDAHDTLTFNAGDHNHALRIKFTDYERLVAPTFKDFSEPEA